MIAMHPWYTNALSEKAVMLASMQEWEQALDTAQRALDVDGSNIDAMKVTSIVSPTSLMSIYYFV